MYPTRWAATILILAAGCTAVERDISVRTSPTTAMVQIDNVDKGPSPLVVHLSFDTNKTSYILTARRPGYKAAQMLLGRESPQDLLVELERESKRVTVRVTPAAQITIEGPDQVRQSPGMVASFSPTLPFTIDDRGQWTTYTITAKREGWKPATAAVNWTDADVPYQIKLEPLEKEFRLTTVPEGAAIVLDGKTVGASPVAQNLKFCIDPDTGKWTEYHFIAQKTGYDPTDILVSWDEARKEYSQALKIKHKSVRIASNPSGAVMILDGRELERDAAGTSLLDLTFPPDMQGVLPTFKIDAAKKTADADYYPASLNIGWDQGKTDYALPLREIVDWQMPLLSYVPQRKPDGWVMVAQRTQVWGTKSIADVSSPAMKGPAVRVRGFSDLGQLDTLAVSPDGVLLVAAVLSAKDDAELHAQLVSFKADGSPGSNLLTDGLNLDFHPCFTPDGKQIVFSSNRGGRRLSIWSFYTSGNPGGKTSLTSGDRNDLLPFVDETKHLYYQAMVDSRPDPRVYRNDLGQNVPTDLLEHGGMRPQVNAANDTLLYTSANPKTGKRELFKMSLKDGLVTNLTNSPDYDCFDPVWSPGGDRIAFVSDRAVDTAGRHNLDIWIMDPNRPEKAYPMTTNGSQDDCPVWDAGDPSGHAIYFRSNRGRQKEWAIWCATINEPGLAGAPPPATTPAAITPTRTGAD